MENFIETYCVHDLHTYNDNYPYDIEAPIKIISTKEDNLEVKTMLQMEMIAKSYGVNFLEYRDHTNYELLDEMTWMCNTREERDRFHCAYYDPSNYELYYEQLAIIAEEIGCERAQIKCMIKSLLHKYAKVEYITQFPHREFNELYSRFIISKDIEQLRVAERLCRYHIQQYERFLRDDVDWKFEQVERMAADCKD